jgi:deazaflavin-dependent oxidoreductase (nitroreductase family)
MAEHRRPRRNTADRFRSVWRIMSRLEALEVRWSGTSGVALLRRTPVLVLETTGRRTGRQRRTPVAYWQDDDVYFVGGGAAGMTRVDWVANLRAQDTAIVWVRRRRIAVKCEELAGGDEERARREAFARWPNAPSYERKSGRRIPYFRLTPIP